MQIWSKNKVLKKWCSKRLFSCTPRFQQVTIENKPIFPKIVLASQRALSLGKYAINESIIIKAKQENQ